MSDFELTSQIRRARVLGCREHRRGICSSSLKERAHFLNIAEASLAEVGYCLHVAKRLEYIGPSDYEAFDLKAKQVAAPLVGLIRMG
jgi:four helix bundle protein